MSNKTNCHQRYVINKNSNKLDPNISVIIPTFNRPLLLSRAIKSVLNQTYNNFEIIVVNDSRSEDDVKNIIKGFNDSKIHYLTNKRKKGGNGARNTGVLFSSGKYVAFLDDDDTWFTDKLLLQYNAIKSLDDSWGGACTGYKLKKHNKYKTYTNYPNGNLKKLYILGKFSIGASSTLFFKKDVFLKIGLFDEEMKKFQDNELVIRYLNHYKLFCVRKPLVTIYGHNFPNADEYLLARKYFIQKIKTDLNNLSVNDQNYFYSSGNIHQAYAYAKEHKYKSMYYYLRKSIKYKKLKMKMYIKLIYYILISI